MATMVKPADSLCLPEINQPNGYQGDAAEIPKRFRGGRHKVLGTAADVCATELRRPVLVR